MQKRQKVWSIRGGGMNKLSGKVLPFYYHIHKKNWYKPWLWFKRVKKMNIDFNSHHFLLEKNVLENLSYISLASYYDKIFTLRIEIDNFGFVVREVGNDINNKIIHKTPSRNYENGTYGIFDNVPLNLKDLNKFRPIDKTEFETHFTAGSGFNRT